MSKILNMVNTRMFVFKHPKYYKELRERNRDLSELQQVKLERSVPQSDQAISLKAHDGERERAPDPGHKPQAASFKHQASSPKLLKHQATSVKPQAASVKLKPASVKLHDS